MSKDKINSSGGNLDLDLFGNKTEMTSEVEKENNEGLLKEEATADLAEDTNVMEAENMPIEDLESNNDQESNELSQTNSIEDKSESIVDENGNNAIAEEFNLMNNVINGKKRTPKKRKRPMSKQGKICVYTAVACVCIAFLSVVAYFGSMFLGNNTPTQGIGGTDLVVDMTDCDYYVGTSGKVDLSLAFPNGKNFKADGSVRIRGTDLEITDTSMESFTLTFSDVTTVGDKEVVTEVTKTCKVVVNEDVADGTGSVNVTTWDEFKKAAAANNIIVLQNDIACPTLRGEKRAKHGSITIRNHVYGNGNTINLFELTVSRTKDGGSKVYGAPYLQGNGKVWGDSGLVIRCRADFSPLIFQDVHVTGCDMSLDPAVYEGDENTPEQGGDGEEEVAPTADEEEETRKLIKPAGNLYGLEKSTVDKRGVLLFSKNGNLVDVSGENGEKGNTIIKHCVIENGAKVLHISNSVLTIEGSVVRNAADTAVSIATTHNEASTIYSKNNVIANSLTGGILFYCFDDKITAENAEATWNHFYIEGFLDIYNWKNQNGLAFLPETEGFADIANPIAGSEIPKVVYDPLKGKVDGQKYIHFAIIRIRTGNGLPKNESTVHGYEDIGYSTSRENKFKDGFPIPGIAKAIMKELEVWGYYSNIEGSVHPTSEIGGGTAEGLELFYKELREGRQPKAEQK